MKDTLRLEKAFTLSVQEVEAVLSGEKPINDKTRLASATIGNYAKIKSVEVHEYALDVAMSRLNGGRLVGREKQIEEGARKIGKI